jgi:hypothetical protein
MKNQIKVYFVRIKHDLLVNGENTTGVTMPYDIVSIANMLNFEYLTVALFLFDKRLSIVSNRIDLSACEDIDC